MKATSLILIILGYLLIVFNILGYFGKMPAPPETGTVNTIAFYVGYNIFLIVGSILLFVGYRLRKKAKYKKVKKDLLSSFLTDIPGK